MPAAVPAAMVMVPLVFKVNPVGTVTPVKVTSVGITAAPFKVSLASTEAVVAPVYPLIGPYASATAQTQLSTVTAAPDVEQVVSDVERTFKV